MIIKLCGYETGTFYTNLLNFGSNDQFHTIPEYSRQIPWKIEMVEAEMHFSTLGGKKKYMKNRPLPGLIIRGRTLESNW